MNVSTPRGPQPLMAWLQLLRVPNVFTAIADVSMGYLVADGGARRPALWLMLIVISSCLYLGGIVLNDVFDFELDRRERPERPLPSGRIARPTAALVGGVLLSIGVLLAWPAAAWSQSAASPQFTPGLIALALAICVLFYDGLFKATPLGPLFMGGCRFLNVMLGVGVTENAALFQTATPWIVAGGIGLFVMGITWFARNEAVASPRSVLWAGLTLMLIGVAVLTLLPFRGGLPPARQRVMFAQDWVWPMLIWVLTAPVWRRSLAAIVRPQPERIQMTIKQALLSLIVLDAAIALLVAGPGYALGLLALMIPAAALGRFVSAT
jgi:4-hydroxybenzoate polyprenyltransferase